MFIRTSSSAGISPSSWFSARSSSAIGYPGSPGTIGIVMSKRLALRFNELSDGLLANPSPIGPANSLSLRSTICSASMLVSAGDQW